MFKIVFVALRSNLPEDCSLGGRMWLKSTISNLIFELGNYGTLLLQKL